MAKLQIKTFVSGNKRPKWLLELLSYINCWYIQEDTDTTDSIMNFLHEAINQTEYVRRNDAQPLINFVRIEETDDTITIRTVYKDCKMIEFKIVETL